MNIEGKKTILRAVEVVDLPLLHKWGNDPKLQHTMGTIYFPSSVAFHQQWYDKLLNDKDNQRLAIITSDGQLLGISSIINIDWRNKHAWHGIMLGDVQTQGKGYGMDAVMATMRYAFDELGLERLDGSMIEYNTVSIDFYTKKLGWKIEGEKKNFYFHQGKWWKQIIVGITKEEYKYLIETNHYWDE